MIVLRKLKTVTHKVKCLQYERVTYEHKGEQKKKLQPVEKFLTLSGLLDLMQQRLYDFPRHRFNVNHTRSVWNQVEEFLENAAVVKMQDFSENYASLLSKEVQSLHWNQEQCSIYPVAVLRNVDSEIHEDHFAIISDDTKHDVPFVELANKKIHEYYRGFGVSFDIEIEFNDGCASQYKSKTAIYHLVQREKLTVCVYFEASHGKNKSDGLGGVIKSYVSREVGANELIIRNGRDMYEFCVASFTIVEGKGKMLSCHFIWLKEDLEAVRANIADDGHCRIRGMRKLHQVITKSNKRNGVFIRAYACLCNVCIKGRVECCQAAESNQHFRHSIDVLKAKWYQFHEIDSDEDNDNEELDEIDMFIESDVTKYIVKGDIAIICMLDDHNYYLAKLITNIYEIEESEKDDYNHVMHAHQKFITCSYLEVHKNIKEGTIYYIDRKRKLLYLLIA